MSLCQEFGRWVEDQVITPVEQFFEDARQVCTESRRWIEREIRTPLETWVSQEEQRCREQECNWWCLCCNKWFCWIVTVLVRVIVWIIKVVIEWIVEVVCLLVVEIIRIIVLLVINVLRWIVELVVCFVEKFCQFLILAAAVALVAALLGVVGAAAVMPVPLALPAFVAGGTVALAALLLARVLCELSMCRFVGVIVWALKWAIVLGAVASLLLRSVGSGLVVAMCGGAVSALVWWLTRRGCAVPRLLGAP